MYTSGINNLKKVVEMLKLLPIFRAVFAVVGIKFLCSCTIGAQMPLSWKSYATSLASPFIEVFKGFYG